MHAVLLLLICCLEEGHPLGGGEGEEEAEGEDSLEGHLLKSETCF